MSDGVYYNQEVTAQMLNDIAIDLGATTFNGFGVEKFGADELNNITKAIVSKGILKSYDECEPFLSDGMVYIKSGVIVFANGAKKAIAEPLAVECVAGSYIYALNDTAAGTASIIVGEEPSEGDFVNIASVSDAGALTDIRTFAVAKVELSALPSNMYYDFTITNARFESTRIDNYNTKYYTMPIEGLRYLVLTDVEGFDATTKFGIIDLSAAAEEEQSIQIERSDFAATVKVLRTGAELRIRSVRGGGTTLLTHTYHFTLV